MLIQKHIDLIENFYAAFSKGDADGMIACYHQELEFNDPVFGDLDYNQACAMWQMLNERSNDLEINFQNAWSENEFGGVDWDAKYTFSKTGRKIHNLIDAKFEFKGGLIVGHRDHFDMYKWCQMAFGSTGFLLGWTGYMQNKIRTQASGLLEKHLNEKG